MGIAKTEKSVFINILTFHPEKVKELSAKWEAWAARVGVYPRAEGQPPVKKG